MLPWIITLFVSAFLLLCLAMSELQVWKPVPMSLLSFLFFAMGLGLALIRFFTSDTDNK